MNIVSKGKRISFVRLTSFLLLQLLLVLFGCSDNFIVFTSAKPLIERTTLSIHHHKSHRHSHNRNRNRNHNHKYSHHQLIHNISRGGATAATSKTTSTSTSTRRRSTKTTTQPPPPPPKLKKINPHFAVLYGMILAFNSGLINGVTLSGILSSTSTKQPSSAVTGSWTNSALGVASGSGTSSGSNGNGYLAVKCILSYMGGSFISGVLNPYPMNYSMKRFTVRPCFFIASLAMYGSSVLADGGSGGGGSSSSSSSSHKGGGNDNWILLAVLANGIQNSITSSLTGNLMRSAHYSGITSDIGTFIGQALRGNKANGLKLKVFIVLAASFWLGGFFSLGLVEKFGSGTLLISSILYLFFSLFSI